MSWEFNNPMNSNMLSGLNMGKVSSGKRSNQTVMPLFFMFFLIKKK